MCAFYAYLILWLTAHGQLNCKLPEPQVPCALIAGAFIPFEVVITCSKRLLWHSSQPYHLRHFAQKTAITWSNMMTIQQLVKSSVFKPIVTY